MFFASRNVLRLSRTHQRTLVSRACYSTSPEYHSLDDQLFHELKNPMAFQGEKAPVFDATTKERKFVPWELKELGFKHVMGLGGVWVWDHMLHLNPYSEAVAAAFIVNYIYQALSMMTATVHKIELHRDGKHVTVTPSIGAPMTVKIADMRKLKSEKELITTFEESYLFPVQIAGKKYYLHGQGQEAIKHGEAFRAIINGQSIKL